MSRELTERIHWDDYDEPSVVIPKEILDALGWRVGDDVTVTIANGTVVLVRKADK